MNKLLKITWGVFAPFIVLTCCVVVGSDLVTTMTAMTGIVFVICVAFRIPIGNLIGAFLCAFLAISSWYAGFHVNAIVNMFILLPMQVAAYFQWKNGFLSKGTKKFAINRHWQLFTCLSALYVVVGLLTGSTMLTHDAISGAMLVTATFLLMSDTYKQWYYWIPCNAIEAFMWVSASYINPLVTPIAVSRGIFLLNSCLGFYEWRNNERNKG